MNLKWLSLLSGIMYVIAIMAILVFANSENKYIVNVENFNVNKKTDILYQIQEREYKYVDTYALKVGETVAINAGSDGIVAYYGEQSRVISHSSTELAWRGMADDIKIAEIMSYDSIYSFNALVTGYGPDCRGCRGITATGHDAEKSIYYDDPEFGEIRIVAVDANKYKYGSVFRISNYRDWEPFLAIALDCGGAINGNDLDLLYYSETLGNRILGLDKNVDANMIRRGY